MNLILAAALLLSPVGFSQTVRTGPIEGSFPAGLRPAAGLNPIPSLQAPALSGPAPGLSSALPTAERLALIQAFREKAGLTPLSPATLTSFSRSPETTLQAQTQAAQAFLAKLNPAFDTTITPESEFTDPPLVLEHKKLAAAARRTLAEAGVWALADKVGASGKIDPSSLERVYTGDRRILELALRLPLTPGTAVAALIQDGAPKAALAQLQKFSPPDKTAVRELSRALKDLPEASDIRPLTGLKEKAESLLRKGRYGEALAAARSLGAAVKEAALREGSRRSLWLEAISLEQAIKDKGAAALYGSGGKMSAKKLAERVSLLMAGDPNAYVGAPLSAQATRIQCYGDCAIQQAYNHPKLSLVAEQMPYPVFLNAVEGKLGDGTRHEGLMDMESDLVLRELGLARVRRGAPKDAEELAALLKARGALMLTVRWEKAEDHRGSQGNHAVLVQGALSEAGKWTFVVIDSNYSRPQLYSFDELGVFGGRTFDSVEALPATDRRLPEALRAIADPEKRVRKGINLFYGRYGALRSKVAWYKRLVFAPVNFIREKLGLEALEPAPYERLDPNLTLLGKIPSRISQALRLGVRFPPETLVTASDGKRYLNLFAAEQFLNGSSY